MADEKATLPQKDSRDLIRRGSKVPTPAGTATFVGLRALDLPLQYGILARGVGSSIIRAFGGQTLPHGPPAVTNTFLDRLELSPYRLILFSMAVGTFLKQTYWVTVLSQDEFPPYAAAAVSGFNTVMNSVNDLLFTCKATSASANGEFFPQTPLIVGASMYLIGMFTEVVAENQRLKFKKDPANKGRLCDKGFWSWSRHVNYAGYILVRGGYATAAGGFIWGMIAAGAQLWDFHSRAIPVLSKYCQNKYGDQWIQYTQKTPYKMFPYIY